MASNYIPQKEVHAVQWMRAFANGIAAAPEAFMIAPAQAESIMSVVNDYEAKFKIASNPALRTRATIADKDDARHMAETLCRQYATLIKHNLGVSDGDKINIGVRPINIARNRSRCPQTVPWLKMVAATPGAHTMRYSDSLDANTPRKPFGAAYLQLFLAIGDHNNLKQADARYYGQYTKNPILVKFDQPDGGKWAVYYGRWAGRHGDTGPWSLPARMHIAA